ncbi:MAG TPA: CsbD family protein, partial [Luteimonas sp.]|nr:CsbD family protein [Luteimonas sp.]
MGDSHRRARQLTAATSMRVMSPAAGIATPISGCIQLNVFALRLAVAIRCRSPDPTCTAFSLRVRFTAAPGSDSPAADATAINLHVPALHAGMRNRQMDDNNNRGKGAAHEVKGAVKEAVGKAT